MNMTSNPIRIRTQHRPLLSNHKPKHYNIPALSPITKLQKKCPITFPSTKCACTHAHSHTCTRTYTLKLIFTTTCANTSAMEMEEQEGTMWTVCMRNSWKSREQIGFEGRLERLEWVSMSGFEGRLERLEWVSMSSFEGRLERLEWVSMSTS